MSRNPQSSLRNPQSKTPTPPLAHAIKWEVWMGMSAWYIVGDIGAESWLQITPPDYIQPHGKPRISEAARQAADATVSYLVRTHRYKPCAGTEIAQIFGAHLAKIKRLAPVIPA